MSQAQTRLVQVLLTGGLLAVSMVLGLASQALIAFFFGAGVRSDALFLARDLSDLSAKLLLAAQATGVLVPLVVSLRARSGAAAADRALAAVLTTFTLVTLAVAAVIALAAEPLVSVLAPGFEDDRSDLSASLLRIVAFTMPGAVVSLLAVSALQARDRFGRGMSCNVIGGLVTLGAMPVLVHWEGVEGAAWAMLAGTTAQALAAWVFLRLEGVPAAVAPWRARAELRDFLRRLAPYAAYAGASQGSGVVYRVAASLLNAGLYAVLSLAYRLYRALLTLLLSPLQQVLLPALSRSEADERPEAADAELVATLRYALWIVTPVAVATAALAGPLVELVFQRGEFTAQQADRTATALAVFAAALVPTGAVMLLEQAAFARRRTRLVVGANLVLEGVQASLYVPLVLWLGVEGIALAVVCGITLTAVAYLRGLRPRGGAVGEQAPYLARVALSGVVLLAVVLGVAAGADALLDPRAGLPQAVVILPATLAGAAAYLLCSLAVGLREPTALAGLLRALAGGQRGAAPAAPPAIPGA